MRRIVVLRALKLGDMLCAIPALRALRQAAPAATITLIGLPWAQDFARRFAACIDDFIAFPGFPGMPEQPFDARALPPFLAALQAQPIDLAIQLHGSGPYSTILTGLLGARACAGFVPEGEPCAAIGAGTAWTCLPWRGQEHEILRWLRLMEALGAPALGTQLAFPVTAADARALAEVAGGLAPPGRYVVVHPGASLASRRWPAERFAQVADALAGRGLQIVLTGSAGEVALTAAVSSHMRAPALDLAGATGLGALAALVRQARLLVCNDTGVSHLGAAFGTPSVVVCCGADPARFAPLDHVRHRVLAAAVSCRPCMHARCPTGHDCALAVSVQAVVDAAFSAPAPSATAVPPAGSTDRLFESHQGLPAPATGNAGVTQH